MATPERSRTLKDPTGSVGVTFSYPDPDTAHYEVVDVNGKVLDKRDTTRADGDQLLTTYVSMNWIEEEPPTADQPAGAATTEPSSAQPRPTGTGPGF